MASTSSSHQQNAFSGIEPPKIRRKVEESSRLFDVFINHRAPDVKRTLATQLYNSLEQLGIRVFLDSEEKELGTSYPSTIESVIRSASVHIAIFSRGYAHSAWCLAELVLMLQSKAKIIPVFYQVLPWELRNIEKGVYAGAFLYHEKKGRYIEKIKEWKDALQSVSFTIGYEFNDSDFRDCKEIVSAVEKEVHRKRLLHVAKHPVALHKLVRDFERQCLPDLVQDSENKCGMNTAGKKKANFVGIFGMGGVGKTTLSKELFNQMKSKYTRASILFDVGEASARAELPSLQSKLLKDLFCEDHIFRDIEEGTSVLSNRLKRSDSLSFLFVLDDIDHVEELDALLVTDILRQSDNNLVIITTRDVGVLARAGVYIGYHLKGLDSEDGKKLFCWHAFGQSFPLSGYEHLVQDFVNMCGGLPLSLQVLGRHVHGRTQWYWQNELEKVKLTLPKDIKKRLKISFDSLDKEEKQIFMDIACFFNEKSITKAMTIWEGSGWRARGALETLKDKCLVEEVEEKYLNGLDCKWESNADGLAFRMHNHHRDLGREMADELGYPLRFWHPQDLGSLESKGFQNILAQTKGRCFHSIFDKSIGCGITYFLGEPKDGNDTSLLWLQLEYSSCRPLDLKSDINSSIPSWIPLQYLQCLRVSNGCFQKLWQSNVQAPSLLKELQIRETFLKEFPDLSGELNNMKKLVISKCPELEELPSLARASCLEQIEIDSCEKLQSITLPTTVISLSVRSCRNLRRVEGTEDLMQLENFEISDCGKLEFENLWEDKEHAPLQLRELIITGTWRASFERFPSSISYLKNLKKVALVGDAGKQFGIKRLPEEFCDLQSLEHLELRHCALLSLLPARFGDLRNLQHLDLCSCKAFRTLPISFQRLEQLKHLDLSGCKRLVLQEDILNNIRQLENLYLSGCLALQKIPDQITDQACLRDLQLQHTSLEDLPKNIGHLSKLEVLTIGSPLMKSLPDSLGNLSSLKSLSITDCFTLECLPKTLGDLVFLEHLCIESTGVTSLPEGFGQLANLRTLKISDCPLSELVFVSVSSLSLEKLAEINLSATLVTGISISAQCCPRLETLRLSKNDNLEVIETLPATVNNIELSDCETLKNIKGIRDLPIPPILTISYCPELEKPSEF